MSEWISVKEKLPPVGKEILFYAPKCAGTEIGYFNKVEFCIYRISVIRFSLKEVTFWMHLPKPPKNLYP